MARITETAYPQLKTKYTAKELKQLFTPSHQEKLLMENHTRPSSPATQVAFMVMLKCYQCVGKAISLAKVPTQVIKYISKTLNKKIDKNAITYHPSRRKQHISIIRQYLHIVIDNKARRRCMKAAALDAAKTKENLADIINNIIDHLIKGNFELPTYRYLLRLARASRKVTTEQYYHTIDTHLTTELKNFIDELFVVDPNDTSSPSLWWQIKQEPKSPTSRNINAYIRHLNWLMELRQQIPSNLDFIPPARIEQFVAEAISLDAADMKKVKPYRRYTLATLLIYSKSAKAIDDLCAVFILWIRKLHTNAKKALEDYRNAHVSETDSLIGLLYKITMSVKESQSDSEKLNILNTHITKQSDSILNNCEKHLAYAGDNYFSFMLKPYLNKRYLFFKILNHLDIKTASQDNNLIDALEFIHYHRQSKKKVISTLYENSDSEEIQLNIDWLSDKWFEMVTGKSTRTDIISINRHYFELAVMNELTHALNAADVYVENGYQYDDPNKQYIAWDGFEQGAGEYCQMVNLSKLPSQFIIDEQHKLRDTATAIDKKYPRNSYLTIENGVPILKKRQKKAKPNEIKRLSQKIADNMTKTNIVDIIYDVEKWLNLSAYIKPFSGFEGKMKDKDLRFTATSFAYGCNIGPTETERSLQKFSRKQIAYLFYHHVQEDTLNDLSTRVINRYNQFELPNKWGNGKSVSVDGTYWDMYKKNLLAAHHIRYGQFGEIGYYHVSDKYIALYGNFISCGMHESHYLFDGILDNDSDIQPEKVHGDTGAQTEVAFAFAYLLGIELMPRIRNLKNLRYYKSTKADTFKHIGDLFCDESINWELIARHYHDMLRIVMSVRAGKIKASTILKKLCSHARKNKIYYAFRELGRVIRTRFLLKYIDSPNIRDIIQAGTCKSEEFNQFMDWVRFGDGGVVGDNMSFNQQKIIKFGNLVANMVVLHVTANMTKVINKLKKQGEKFTNDVLASFSPYRTDHINRIGVFPLDNSRRPMKLVDELYK